MDGMKAMLPISDLATLRAASRFADYDREAEERHRLTRGLPPTQGREGRVIAWRPRLLSWLRQRRTPALAPA